MKLMDGLNISTTTYGNLCASYNDILCKRRGALENLEIKKVIFNEPATIVFWSDGSKTVVKCGENDFYDHEKGLAMCIVKRFLGNKGNYYKKLRKWLDIYEEEEKTMNNEGYKEVYFDKYCKTCKYKNLKESDYPCDECLEEAVNVYSHKPVKYEEEEK